MLNQDERVQLFPALGNHCYLNTAWRGPISKPARDAVAQYTDGLMQHGVHNWDEWGKAFAETRELFAKFIGADAGEVIFLAHATDAFSRIALGIDFEASDEIVVPRRDYPGIVRPLLALRDRGVVINMVACRDDGSMPAEDLLAACTEKTRLVAASHVDFRTGYRLDIHQLAAECRKRDILTAIDCVQSVGALPLDMHDVDADFATFASRKWLNSLDTLGALYVRKASMGAIKPHMMGTHSVVEPFNFDKIEQYPAPDTKRFLIGAPAMPVIYSLRAALQLQQKFGQSSIGERVLALGASIRAEVASKGSRCMGDDWPEANRSQIVSILREGKLSDEGLKGQLEDANVGASVRQGILRVAPHYYNNEDDLARLFGVLTN
ncbi:aminotransferase class V-fold PLP-dependent enzyme [Planctomycetota bacterium]|nr:aminotransferase class V-fold PLP-dependent enzyme [Planctomycetota bacterium]